MTVAGQAGALTGALIALVGLAVAPSGIGRVASVFAGILVAAAVAGLLYKAMSREPD